APPVSTFNVDIVPFSSFGVVANGVRRFTSSNGFPFGSTAPLDYCDAQQVARDVALIRLDQRVSTSIATPIHPPIPGAITCDQSGGKFTGTILGFGFTSILNQWPLDTGAGDARTANDDSDWARVVDNGTTNTAPFARYRDSWFITPVPPID